MDHANALNLYGVNAAVQFYGAQSAGNYLDANTRASGIAPHSEAL